MARQTRGRGGGSRGGGSSRGDGKRHQNGRFTKARNSHETSRFTTSGELEDAIKKQFDSIDDYAEVHRSATDFEFDSQAEPIRAHNESNHLFDAWVIAAPPEDAPSLGFIFRVKIESWDKIVESMPKIGDKCEFRFTDGEKQSDLFYTERTGNHLPIEGEFNDYPEFKVLDINSEWIEFLKPKIHTDGGFHKLHQKSRHFLQVDIQLHLSLTTYNAETRALSHLMKGAFDVQKQVFKFLVLLDDPTSYVDLSKIYPHMVDAEKVTSDQIRSRLLSMYGNLDDDQTFAYRRLTGIPEGVFFLPGAAGSGKTRWCLSVAALAQAEDTNAKVLYLLDINKPLDDAASKMLRLYKDLGLNKKVIRMLKWPKEIRNGKDGVPKNPHRPTEDEDPSDKSSPTRPDFRWDFMEQWKRSEAASKGHTDDEFRAPTLDEAACQFFLAKREIGEFGEIDDFLNIGGIKPSNWDDNHKLAFKHSRDSIERIYRKVLKEADFIATTPVAAFCHFDGMFNPDLVFFDECAHARELSTLISISFFTPEAWFFTGDYRQMSPYVGCHKLDCAQLHLSLLERVARESGISCHLLTNHRALGGLHKLPSDLFYGGEMVSAQSDEDVAPDSLKYLREFFMKFRQASTLPSETGSSSESEASSGSTVPRFVVDCKSNSKVWKNLRSFWNPFHQDWVMARVQELLDDPKFVQVDSSLPGTIMIISPFGESVQRYRLAVEKIPDARKRLRVEPRTLGTAQGAEADLVFLDMVKLRPSHFSNDKKRLCVALTRARQAEVIMMTEDMAHGEIPVTFDNRGRALTWEPAENLRAIYDGCYDDEHGTLIVGKEKDASPEKSQESEKPGAADSDSNAAKSHGKDDGGVDPVPSLIHLHIDGSDGSTEGKGIPVASSGAS